MIKDLPIQRVREFSEIIWHHLQNECFNTYEEAVQQECINTISLLCAVLTNTKQKFGTVHYDSISEKVISEVLQKCREEFETDPDTLTGILAQNILSAIMKHSALLCETIVENFVIYFAIGKKCLFNI